MKKSNTNLILIISAILFVISVGLFVYTFRVIENKNKHTSAVVSTLNNKIAEKENIIVLNKKMEELGDMQKRIGGYLVDTGEIDTFVGYLEEMGADNNVDLSVKSVEVPKNEKNKISLSIDMRGSFENVLKGISLLENAPYNISITSLFLNKDLREEVPDSNISSETTSTKTKEVIGPAKSIWQANLSFSVLSL